MVTPEKNRELLIVDFETSGFIGEGGQGIEIGAILVDPDTLEPRRYDNGDPAEFSCLIQFETSRYTWSKKAERIHGYTQEYLQEYGYQQSWTASLFFNFLNTWGYKTPTNTQGMWYTLSRKECAQLTFVGHNFLNFDQAFLDQLIGKEGMRLGHFKPWDTMHIAEWVNRVHSQAFGYEGVLYRDPDTQKPSVSLEAIAAKYGVPYIGAHSAIEDCRILQKCLKAIMQQETEILKRAAYNKTTKGE